MRFRLIAALGLISLCLAAPANVVSVAQLRSFIRSSIKLKHPDKAVADTLRTMKLKEHLEDKDIEELQGEGAGPRTVAALKILGTVSATLPPAAPPPPPPVYVPPPPPSSEDQAKVLEEVKEYALNYSKNLPNFICLEVTRRYYDPTGAEAWRKEDTITAQLSYFEQREEYKLKTRNDQVYTGKETIQSLGGSSSSGEFGSMMREIFEPRAQTTFAWTRWTSLRKRRAHVFAYKVPLESSKYSIEYHGEHDKTGQRIVSGYHGEIFVDYDTNMVVRISLEADTIPPGFPVQMAKTRLDYELTKISNQEFMLPLSAEVRMKSDRLWTKNDKEFRLYNKFGADTSLKFDDIPAPLTDDKTKEQPPAPKK